MEIKEKIAKIADTYGYDAQSRQCIEEMAELTQAINKFWRKVLKCGRNHEIQVVKCNNNLFFPKEHDNLIEEIADVQIMLWQMEHLLGADITPIVEKKLNRQIGRIEDKS